MKKKNRFLVIGLCFCLTICTLSMSGMTFAAEQPGSQTMRAAAMSNVTIANATEGSLQALVDQKLGGVPDYTKITFLTVSGTLNETDFNFVCDNMTNLEYLDLTLTGVTGDLSKMSGLTALKRMNLWSTKVSGDLKSLAGLTEMEDLNLGGINDNITGDLSDLKGMTNLKKLVLESGQITGALSDVTNFSNLQSLVMDNTKLHGELSELADLDRTNPSLTSLNLGATQVRGELSDLNWSKVKELYLSSTQIYGELTKLGGFKALERLEVGTTGLRGDFSGLSAVPTLKILGLSYTELKGDLRKLVSLDNLQSLYLSGDQILGNLNGLAGLKSLKAINIISIHTTGDIEELNLFENLAGEFAVLQSLTLTVTLPPITFDGAAIAVKVPTKGSPAMQGNIYGGTYNDANKEVVWAVPKRLSGNLSYQFKETINIGDKSGVELSCSVKQPYTVKPQPSPSGSIITASAGEHGSISPEGTVWAAYGSDKTFQFVPEDGYKVKDVVIDGDSAGAISSYTFKMLTKPHTIDVTFEPEETPEDRLIAGVKATTIKASSQAKKGKMIIRWKKSWGYKVDCFQIFRSTKKNSGFGKKPFFTTRNGTKNMYTNTKQLKKGTRYYYKIRGVRVIDGQTIYTKWSNKAYRIAK